AASILIGGPLVFDSARPRPESTRRTCTRGEGGVRMWSWFTFWLILHILAAIVAFGPTVRFPIIAARARKDPQHGAFGAALIEFIQKRVTLPVALVIPVTGVGLIYSAPGQIN